MRWYIGVGILLLSMGAFMSVAKAAQTDNLLPNANNGVDWNSSSTDIINSGGSGVVYNGNTIDGFTVTCPTQQSNCGYKYDIGGDFEVTGTATLSANDIKLYNNTITQSMLDEGITLESNIDVANCESNQGNCESKGGANDSHTVTITLKDNSGDILSTVSQTRTEVTGFQGNCNGYPNTNSTGVTADCGQYTDTMIFTGVGANTVDWSWTGIDSNYTNQSRQGSNLLGASLVMTYEEFTLDLDIEDVAENFIDIEEDLDFDFVDLIDEFEIVYDAEIPFMEIEPEFLFFDELDSEPMDYDFGDVDMLPLGEEDDLPFFVGDEMMIEDEGGFFDTEETMFVELEVFEEEVIEEEMPEMVEEDVEVVESEEESEVTEEETSEFAEIEEEAEVESEPTTLTEAAGEPKEGSEVVEVTTNSNIAVEVKEVVYTGIAKYMKENQAKLEQLLDNQVFIEDTVFYEPQDIYVNQVVFVDNRNIYQDIVKIDDPMTQYNLQVTELQKKKIKLQQEIQELKWKQ